MGNLLLALLITLIIVIPFAVLLARQGFPGWPHRERADRVREREEDPVGPTDEPYPPGSRPAGPGAERMTDEPPTPGRQRTDPDFSDESGITTPLGDSPET